MVDVTCYMGQPRNYGGQIGLIWRRHSHEPGLSCGWWDRVFGRRRVSFPGVVDIFFEDGALDEQRTVFPRRRAVPDDCAMRVSSGACDGSPGITLEFVLHRP